MYETILFPTDGSDESLRALEHALDLASTYDATLHVLYVVDTGYPHAGVGDSLDLEEVHESVREHGQQTVADVEARATEEGVECVGVVREADGVARGIMRYAEEHDADLVVVGTHYRHGLDRELFWSVTERLGWAAEVPVLTVRSAPGDEEE